jgi:hypothetical protein
VIDPEFAQFADAPLHEFTIYTLHSIRSAQGSARDSNNIAFLEYGLADYFPSSFTNNSNFGWEIWEALRKKNGTRVSNRNLDNHRLLTELDKSSEGLDGGNVWAGAFWQLRQTIGQVLSDKLLLAAWKNLDATKFATDISLYPRELMKQDEAIEGGKHSQDIKKVFEERGLKF